MIIEGSCCLIFGIICLIICMCFVLLFHNKRSSYGSNNFYIQENMKSNHESQGPTDIDLKSLCNKIQNGDISNGCIVFHADWCGHCKQLKQSGELDKVSKSVPVYLVNCTDDPSFKDYSNVIKFEIEGYPTLCKISNNQIIEISTNRTADDIISKCKN